MSNPFITPTSYSVSRAQELLTEFQDGTRYLFAGDHRPSTNTVAAPLSQASSNTYYEPWQQMLFGKRVTHSALAIANQPYTYGNGYDRWDDQLDPTTLEWYAIVNAGSYSHVFGCLDNANGALSTVQPDFTQATSSATFQYQTSDGYRWMYLCSTDAATVANLATPDLFPLLTNNAVSNAAIDGAIDVIGVNFGGKGYNNYTAGTFQSSDVKVNAQPTLYQLSNSGISSANGFYTGGVLVITSGTGVGQFATIHDYTVTTAGNFANLNSAFTVAPTNGSGWEVFPGVAVISDGSETEEVVARALVNALSSNSVWQVEVLDRGSGFTSPVTTSVIANAVVGVVAVANVTPIMSPRGGHGFDQAAELNATQVLVAATFSNTEGGLVPATNTYRQIGLLHNPEFANVNVTLTGGGAVYLQDETVTFLTLQFGANAVTCNTTSVVVTGDTRLYQNGDSVYITSGLGSQFLATINTVTNATSMNLTSNAAFATVSGNTYSPTEYTTAVVTNPVSGSNVYIDQLGVGLTTGLTMYGLSSQTAGVVSAIQRNDVSKDDSTFVQMIKLKISSLGGSFQQNEYVIQGNSQGLVHSSNSNYLYLTNLTGQFMVGGNNITGNTSGAVAQVLIGYGPELDVGSATIEYFENLSTPLSRGPAQGESFKIAYGF